MPALAAARQLAQHGHHGREARAGRAEHHVSRVPVVEHEEAVRPGHVDLGAQRKAHQELRGLALGDHPDDEAQQLAGVALGGDRIGPAGQRFLVGGGGGDGNRHELAGLELEARRLAQSERQLGDSVRNRLARDQLGGDGGGHSGQDDTAASSLALRRHVRVGACHGVPRFASCSSSDSALASPRIWPARSATRAPANRPRFRRSIPLRLPRRLRRPRQRLRCPRRLSPRAPRLHRPPGGRVDHGQNRAVRAGGQEQAARDAVPGCPPHLGQPHRARHADRRQEASRHVLPFAVLADGGRHAVPERPVRRRAHADRAHRSGRRSHESSEGRRVRHACRRCRSARTT